jgi:hypothetical protein
MLADENQPFSHLHTSKRARCLFLLLLIAALSPFEQEARGG